MGRLCGNQLVVDLIPLPKVARERWSTGFRFALTRKTPRRCPRVQEGAGVLEELVQPLTASDTAVPVESLLCVHHREVFGDEGDVGPIGNTLLHQLLLLGRLDGAVALVLDNGPHSPSEASVKAT